MHPIIGRDVVRQYGSDRTGRTARAAWRAFVVAQLVCLSYSMAGEWRPSPPERAFARPTREVNVLAFGATGDDSSDDTESFQAALMVDDVAVAVPRGTYTISRPLRIPSSRWITAANDAVIRLADGAGRRWDSFLMTNMSPDLGNRDIVIEGGTWDGNNLHNPRKREFHGRSYGGVLISFTNTSRLVLRGLTIRNPESFSLRLGKVTDFVIEDITFDQAHPRPNQDGIHIGGFSHRGLIQRLRVSSPTGTHDDMVAINADDDLERPFNVGLLCGPISDIWVNDVQAADAYTFVRLLSHKHAISNVLVENIRGGFRTNAINADRWRFPPGGGELVDIAIRNITIHHAGEKAEPCISIQSRFDNFSIADVRRTDHNALPGPIPTLVIDNGRPNRVTRRLASASPPVLGPDSTVHSGVYLIENEDIASLELTSMDSPQVPQRP